MAFSPPLISPFAPSSEVICNRVSAHPTRPKIKQQKLMRGDVEAAAGRVFKGLHYLPQEECVRVGVRGA